MIEDTVIKISGLGKKYTIGKEKDTSLRSSISNIFKSYENKGNDFWALQDINLNINKGEVVGIIGKNGAGKSTLLKLLSQITSPSTGSFEITGRVASLLEVGTGFHPELTGRENVYLNGTILGMSRKEVKEKFDEIVEFSGVKKFIDTPVKRYSSGMYVRLAFAVAAHLEPEILIVDEVLAVGDAEFQKKCLGKMSEVAKAGRTVIFVSHNMSSLRNFCTRGVVLNEGKLVFDGDLNKAIGIYSFGDEFKNSINLKNAPRTKKMSNHFSFTKLEVKGEENESKTFLPNQSLTLQLEFEYSLPVENLAVGFSIKDFENKILVECRSFKQLSKVDLKENGIGKIEVEFTPNLNSGTYALSIGAVCKSGDLDYVDSAYMLEIQNDEGDERWYNENVGPFIIPHKWEIIKE